MLATPYTVDYPLFMPMVAQRMEAAQHRQDALPPIITSLQKIAAYCPPTTVKAKNCKLNPS